MRILTISISMLLISASSTFADVNVVASIKPLHSLVASVMRGVGSPNLLLEGNSSPHSYSLKPEDAKKIQQARVIFWIGHELEAFLEKPMQSLAADSNAIALIEAPDVKKLAVRKSKSQESHDHDHEEHGTDPHIWLDPENAKAMLNQIAATLSISDPENAARYAANAASTTKQLEDVSIQISNVLEPTRNKGFIVFHDAYQYFEARYNLKLAAAISIHPENPPGAKQIAAIRKMIIDKNVRCIFAEPQFDDKLITVVLEGTTAKPATLDPIGSDLIAGPELYTRLIQNIAGNFSVCMQ